MNILYLVVLSVYAIIHKDYEPVLLEDTKFGTITAISGCISNNTHVLFKWKKIYTGSTIEEEIIPKFRTPYKSSCSDDFECGNDQQVKYTEIVTSKPNENGNYFLKIEAIYGNESKESFKTAKKYIIEEQDEKEVKAGVIIIVYVVGGLFVLSVAAFCFFTLRQYRRRRKRMKKKKPTKKGSDENKNEESIHSFLFMANGPEKPTNEVVVC
ncbi:uncharacterized protein LOC132758492 isoform X2 [Ruditapes philippinarum]|uniref:uncharacterized protein LOC132758492 isoform X2 n=1 Tax=Ruditapes philippinarum TaxID=129788 RepID=UPI00295BD3BC|nr:uncharacterized protein LOC132758492 isoform X2 [Ruditapes philippinarum]